MIPAGFTYHRAGSVGAAVDLLAEHGEDAKLLAGGQSLLPLLKLRLAAPEHVIDISGIDDLSYVRPVGDQIAIGALTRHSVLSTADVPLLSHVAGLVGDPQVRHCGTIGGSCAHADPSGDLPTALLALDADFLVEGVDGRRTIPAGEFFVGFLETALDPTEVLVEIRVPSGISGWGYQKFTRRPIDWATVAVAAVRRPDPGVALANMGPTPLRAAGVEAALAAGATPADAAAHADAGTAPPSDVTASSEYRRHLAKVLTARALRQAFG